MANKLELTWYGKDEPIRVEPRLLIENAELSNTVADPETQNMLIHGDNLLALKALESKFAGQVKCIYIDPPYNANAANIYEDNIEHSLWLNLIRPRLQIMWRLLGDTGSIWISIDDNERDYLKVLCDEVFGRSSFLASIVWQKRYSRENREAIGDSHEYILVYVKDNSKRTKIRIMTLEAHGNRFRCLRKDTGPIKCTKLLPQMGKYIHRHREIVGKL